MSESGRLSIFSSKKLEAWTLQDTNELANLLCESEYVTKFDIRQKIIEGLPQNISIRVSRAPQETRLDVVAIITSLVKYENGLERLVEIILSYEGQSIYAKKLEKFVYGEVSPSPLDELPLVDTQDALSVVPNQDNQEFADSKEDFINKITEIQKELNRALGDIPTHIWKKLKSEEKALMLAEFETFESLLERLKSGLVYIVFFGKAGVGKSSIINAVLGEDLAEVDAENDHTRIAKYYRHGPWCLVDIPGVMSDPELEKLAIAEAHKASALVFVIDNQPYGPEMGMFETLHSKFPERPTIVFVNKEDVLNNMTKPDQEKVKRRIERDMMKFVTSQEDIVYGSAQIKISDYEMARQELPQLLNRMRRNPAELGFVMNLWNPIERAEATAREMRQKIFDFRVGVARQWVRSAAISAGVAAALLPFSSFYATPAVFTSMITIIFRVLGVKSSSRGMDKIVFQMLRIIFGQMAFELVLGAGAEVLTDTLTLTGVGAVFGIPGNLALGGAVAWRTVVVGEIAIQFARDGFTWEGEDVQAKIKQCKARAKEIYDASSLLQEMRARFKSGKRD